MNTTEELLADVSTDAAFRNAEVIQAAFRSFVSFCPNCDYPKNAVNFDILVYRYSEVKKKIHRLTKLYNIFFTTFDIHAIQKLEFEKLSLKIQLVPIRPCQECKERYNPTKKYRRDWVNKPNVLPDNNRKEFLDGIDFD